MASSRAFDLSEQLKAAVGDFVGYIQNLTPEPWRLQADHRGPAAGAGSRTHAPRAHRSAVSPRM